MTMEIGSGSVRKKRPRISPGSQDSRLALTIAR